MLDALAGEFRGCGKDSVRHNIGECNCRVLDALAGRVPRSREGQQCVEYFLGM